MLWLCDFGLAKDDHEEKATGQKCDERQKFLREVKGIDEPLAVERRRDLIGHLQFGRYVFMKADQVDCDQ